MSKNVKKVTIKDLGEITLKKFKQSKRISLKIKQNGEVLVTMPLSVSYTDGLDFAIEQKNWIQNIHKKMEGTSASGIISNTSNNQLHPFSIQLQPVSGKTFKSVLGKGVLTVFYPEELIEEDERLQSYINRSALEALRIKAKHTLPALIHLLANQHGFKFGALKINRAKTRWGSCSSSGNINLSIYLMLLPQHLIEYVILHELCHTIEMNHGSRFYQLMDKVTHNKTLALKAELKQEGRRWAFLKL